MNIIKDRGEKMKKLIVLMIFLGVMLGTLGVIQGIIEENSLNESTISLYDTTDNGQYPPVPCGDGGTGGGGIPG